jgi:outer membrane protein TolC
VAASIPLGGCSPSWYERSADREVTRIVEERKEQTLAYKPETVAKKTVDPTPTTKAYEKIPVTAIPPAVMAGLEQLETQRPMQPLGPPVPSPENNSLDLTPDWYANYDFGNPQLGPPAPGDVSLNLDLLRSLEYAVTHSRDYQDRMEDLFLATLDVTLQRHMFDPQLFAKTTVQYVGNQGGNTTPYLSAVNVINRIGVAQQLPYGGTITAEQLVDVTRALNDNSQDGESAQTALTASIPLMRGQGLVNLEGLINAERQLIYAVRKFEVYRRAFAVDISSRYFAMVVQQQGINNRRQSYQFLRLLADRAAELFATGRVGLLEWQRAQQNYLNAENSLIDAINQYEASMDNFKITIGMPVRADLDITPVELQVKTPDLERENPDQLAIAYRLELQTARDRIEDARRGVVVAKNGLDADVRLDSRVAVGNPPDEWWYQYRVDQPQYSVGVTVNWPLDRLAERNNYRASLINLERTNRAYISGRDQIVADVRQAVRSMRLAMVTLEIQKRSVELNRKRLEFANDRFLQGKAAILDVVDAESALLSAQDAYDRARANLQSQVLNYLRDTGTLRLNPDASVLAMAMDRAAVARKNEDIFREIDQKLNELEKQ